MDVEARIAALEAELVEVKEQLREGIHTIRAPFRVVDADGAVLLKVTRMGEDGKGGVQMVISPHRGEGPCIRLEVESDGARVVVEGGADTSPGELKPARLIRYRVMTESTPEPEQNDPPGSVRFGNMLMRRNRDGSLSPWDGVRPESTEPQKVTIPRLGGPEYEEQQRQTQQRIAEGATETAARYQARRQASRDALIDKHFGGDQETATEE